VLQREGRSYWQRDVTSSIMERLNFVIAVVRRLKIKLSCLHSVDNYWYVKPSLLLTSKFPLRIKSQTLYCAFIL